MKKTLIKTPLSTLVKMKVNPFKSFLTLALISTTFKFQAQYALVNKLSETITGQTDTVPLAPILKVGNSYVVSANQKVNSTQNDFKTTCLNGNVTTVWSQLYNANTKKAFTTATSTDASGNIYVAGSTYLNSSNGQDLTVIKFNSAGVQQWVKHYNGPGNKYDVASDVIIDASGNVFVTGASFGAGFAMIDYVTIKFDANGNQLWASRYNFSNGFDIPAGLTLDNAGNVIVSGSSSSSLMNNNWDFATVKYNQATGAQMQTQRQVNTGSAKDQLFAQTKDANGNIYTTGITSSNGVNFDVQTIKYDPNMNVVWVKTFDGSGNYDQGADIAIDNIGNVIVTGYSTKTNLTKEILVLSYSSSGNLNWVAQKQPRPDISDAIGVKIQIKSPTEIFIGGNYTINNNTDMAILRFNDTGENTLEKSYNGISNLKDELLDFMVDGNYIVVSGKTYNGTIDQNVTIKYEYKDYSISPTVTPSGANYNADHIIVAFNKPALKMNAINNRDFLFGKLSDFVDDSTCAKIDKIMGSKSSSFEASKIFHKLTEADSLSESRMGDWINIPPFYATLLIKTSTGFNTQMAVDTLQSIKPDIDYSEFNYLYKLCATPNDTKYANLQGALHSTTTYNNAHINCEPAWDFTKGVSTVRVGIYDSGIDYNNSDLNGVVYSGYDYWSNTSSSATDNSGHGTSCAGIVGAKTNNGNGVAGVAGGDVTNSQTGVSLYNYRIANTLTTFISNQNIGQAIITGANGPNAGGDALHVMSNSYGDGSISYDGFLMNATNYANRMGVAFVAARGNNGSSQSFVPATLKEQTILCVGANGYDGHYQNPSNGDNYSSNYGYPLDFVAPGTSQIVHTTKPGTNAFGTFDGTSASTPHVAGLCALLMSYVNQPTPSWDNLANEDCEALIQRTCTDLNGLYGETAGWDQWTGHGRINAGAALAAIESPKYRIRHIDPSHYSTSVSKQVNTVVNNQVRFFTGNSSVAAGNYFMDIYETVTTLNYAIGPNEQIIGGWPLYKASSGTAYYPNNVLTDEPWYCELLSYTGSQAVLKSYTCFIKFNMIGQQINYQYPMNASNVNSAFSLYTYDGTVVGVKENNIDISTFNVYPNPSNGNFTIGLHSNMSAKAKVKLLDVVGKVVYEKEVSVNEGVNRFDLSNENLSEGVYFVNVLIEGNKGLVKKIVIK